ncbi:UNVERIFIED_CONTAM: hypothetical protein K2H54_061664 [Gekko kuhli]
MASLDFPHVVIKIEDEEVPWLPNNQGSEESETFAGTCSAGFAVPKSEVVHGGDPWIPEPVSEEREIPTDYGSELPDVIVKLEEEEEPCVPYHPASEGIKILHGAHSVERMLDHEWGGPVRIPSLLWSSQKLQSCVG